MTRPRRSMLLIASACLLTTLLMGLSLVYGVYAGRHDAPPTGTIIGVKTQLETALGLKRQWRRSVHTDTAELTPEPCPEDPLVILTGGQSNAANALSDPVDGRADLPAYMFHGGQCYRLEDPVLGATGGRGSLWTALGHAMVARWNRPVVFINTAVTATTYEAWLDPRSGYFAHLEDSLAQAAAAGLKPNLVLWHQGESNAGGAQDEAGFAVPLSALLRKLQALAALDEAEFVLFQASVCYGDRRAGNPALIAAQAAVARSLPRVHLGPNTDALGPRDRYDDCHLNGRGRDKVVAMAMETLAPLVGRVTLAQP